MTNRTKIEIALEAFFLIVATLPGIIAWCRL